MILFFDTETTGFPNKKTPRGDDSQPHVVELAAELTDESGKPLSSVSAIIDPGVCNGIRIPEKVAAIHGIDEEKCWRYGLSPLWAVHHFMALLQRAELVVAYNEAFDTEIMAIQAARWLDEELIWPRKFCAMAGARNVIGGANPKLSDSVRHFLGREHIGAHGAWADMRACKDIYFHLQALEKGEPAPKQEISTFPSVQPTGPNAIKGAVDLYPSNPPKSVWDPE